MATTPNPVIICEGDCACHTVRTLHVYHRQFPEIWGAGFNVDEAAEQLVHLLERFLEGAGSDFRRDAIHEALAEVHAFQQNAGTVTVTM